MQPIEIIIIVFSIVFVIGVCIWAFVRKRKGKSVCGCCDCNGDCAKCKEAILKARQELEKKNNKES